MLGTIQVFTTIVKCLNFVIEQGYGLTCFLTQSERSFHLSSLSSISVFSLFILINNLTWAFQHLGYFNAIILGLNCQSFNKTIEDFVDIFSFLKQFLQTGHVCCFFCVTSICLIAISRFSIKDIMSYTNAMHSN